MSEHPVIFDEENPEWTKEDFAKAKRGEDLPGWVKKAFPRTRGPQKAPTKERVTIRLDAELVQRLRNSGKGWQGRVNEILRKAMLG
tara:strand:+ start:373 stop:630 length:258 start_codon:yes stop_codon:yes gene_type:complete